MEAVGVALCIMCASCVQGFLSAQTRSNHAGGIFGCFLLSERPPTRARSATGSVVFR